MSPERVTRLHGRIADLVALLRDDGRREDVSSELPQLEVLHDEIERLMEDRSHPDLSLAERLREALDRIESAHPKASLLIGRISDALSELGI